MGCECPVPSFLPGELWDSPAPHRLLTPRGGRHPHFSHRSKDKAEKPGCETHFLCTPVSTRSNGDPFFSTNTF